LKTSFLWNDKGISVLFLIIALLLLTAVGYVLTYLIPAKQKSVIFPIHSAQSFYIAQAGVEYAIRYSSDQGWRTAADFVRLNNPGVNQRILGRGRFTISYDSAADRLTSTGEITGSDARRTVRVDNFTPFLRLIFDPPSPSPCWATGTRRAGFLIKNVRGENVILTAFSASWTQGPPVRRIQRMDMAGVQKFAGNYLNGRPPVNFNRGGSQQTLLPNGIIPVIVEWNNNLAMGANILITFYTATGKSYPFNLDTQGDGLPSC
jgi:hypothetical protein